MTRPRVLVPSNVAAVALGVDPATIRQWFRRGILTRYGTEKRALVDLAECDARDAQKAA